MFWIAVAVFGCVMLGLYGLRSREKHQEQEAEREAKISARALEVPASVLWHDFKGNAAAAQAQYGGRALLVHAKLDVTTPMPGGEFLLLRTGDGKATMQAEYTGDPAQLGAQTPGSELLLRCASMSVEAGRPALHGCVPGAESDAQ